MMKGLKIFATVVVLIGACAARSLGDGLTDSGLQHPFHLALGGYSSSDSTGAGTGNGGAVKLDYSFFRPTRHEALATVWYGHTSGGEGGHGWIGGTAEYHWRFGGHGIAYYGLGAGYLTSTESGGPSDAAYTTGLGVDLGRFTLESRSLLVKNESAYLFMLGYRF